MQYLFFVSQNIEDNLHNLKKDLNNKILNIYYNIFC